MQNAECRMQMFMRWTHSDEPLMRCAGHTRTSRDRQDSVGKHHLLSGPLRLCAFARGPARTLPTESVREWTRYRVQSVYFHTRMPGSLTQRRRGAEAQSVTDRMNALLRTPCSMKIRANGHPHEPRPSELCWERPGRNHEYHEFHQNPLRRILFLPPFFRLQGEKSS
jgi:hypothetical protein